MMATIDLNIWSYLAMPVGIALCFGPILVVWIKEEFGAPGSKKNSD